MLVIPVERQLDWRRPPWITLALIFLNILVFWGYQGRDADLLSEVRSEYLRSGLYDMESRAYVDYLDRQIRLHGDPRRQLAKQSREALENQQSEWLASVILVDRGFYHELVENGHLYWPSQEHAQWQKTRPPLAEKISRISALQSGLIPAELSISDLVTYQFLHGDWLHLVGNMVFLLVLGVTVELALGGGRYLLAYVLCGVFSGLFYTLFTRDSLLPLVGASGAVSGLMGMYVVLYRLQKIRFFYFVGVYFNYFKAPALILLPYWLGKEIYEYWRYEESGVAYLAHVGGLLAGAGVYALFGSSWLKAREEFYQPDRDEEDLVFREDYNKALSALGQFDFVTARKRFRQLVSEHPRHTGLLFHLYHLEKMAPLTPECLNATRQLLAVLLERADFDGLSEVYREYARLTEGKGQLEQEIHHKVLYGALKNRFFELADTAFEELRLHVGLDMQREAALLMLQELKRHGQQTRIRKYRDLVEQLQA